LTTYGTEGNESIRRSVTAQESLGDEFFGVLENLRVLEHRVENQIIICICRCDEISEINFFVKSSRDDWNWRVQAHRLFDDNIQIFELVDGFECHVTIADDLLNFFVELSLNFGEL
jgi:hypothetical protein